MHSPRRTRSSLKGLDIKLWALGLASVLGVGCSLVNLNKHFPELAPFIAVEYGDKKGGNQNGGMARDIEEVKMDEADKKTKSSSSNQNPSSEDFGRPSLFMPIPDGNATFPTRRRLRRRVHSLNNAGSSDRAGKVKLIFQGLEQFARYQYYSKSKCQSTFRSLWTHIIRDSDGLQDICWHDWHAQTEINPTGKGEFLDRIKKFLSHKTKYLQLIHPQNDKMYYLDYPEFGYQLYFDDPEFLEFGLLLPYTIDDLCRHFTFDNSNGTLSFNHLNVLLGLSKKKTSDVHFTAMTIFPTFTEYINLRPESQSDIMHIPRPERETILMNLGPYFRALVYQEKSQCGVDKEAELVCAIARLKDGGIVVVSDVKQTQISDDSRINWTPLGGDCFEITSIAALWMRHADAILMLAKATACRAKIAASPHEMLDLDEKAIRDANNSKAI